MNPKKFFDIAAKVAKIQDNERNYRLGAVAMRKDGVLVASSNLPTPFKNPDCHAEHRVLRKAGHGATLFVARIDRAGGFRLAKPCPDCQNLCRHLKVKRVYYTIEGNTYGVMTP